MSSFDNETVDLFHRLYKQSNETKDGPPRAYWKGYECVKCPLDLWVYQEIIYELRPEVIVEGGTCSGGTTLFLADVMDMFEILPGRIITIDWDRDDRRPRHERITQVVGNTLHEDTVSAVEGLVAGLSPLMLILDDGHSHEHVYEELTKYGPLLSAGDYLVVEDTDLGGPLWGLDKWLAEQDPERFVRDFSRERFLMTQNPKGYIKCVA